MKIPKLRLGLRYKLVALIVLITTLLLVGVNLLWFNVANRSIRRTTESQIHSVKDQALQVSSSFFDSKSLAMIIHSQTDPLQKKDLNRAGDDLQTFLVQEQDIQELTLINLDGRRLLRINRSGRFDVDSKISQSDDPAFKVTTFLGGASYIGPIRYEEGKPVVDMAVPIVPPLLTGVLNTLSTSSVGSSRPAGEVIGVLKATVSLASLWEELSSLKLAESGTVFIVDDTGKLLFHPDTKLLAAPPDLTQLPAVKSFLSRVTSAHDEAGIEQSLNEYGQPALVSSGIVPGLRWGAIAQVPLSDLSGSTSQGLLLAAALCAGGLVLALVLSLAFAERTLSPVRQLQAGSAAIGSGQFDARINVQTGDEMEQLSDSFNQMAAKLQELYQGLQDRQARIEASINAINLGFIMTDDNLEVLTINKQARETLALLEGTPGGEAWHIDRIAAIFAAKADLISRISECMLSRKPIELAELHLNHRFVTIFIAPIAKGEAIIGCAIVLTDQTERKIMERSKDEFFSIASHELRTPLTVIKGNVSMMREFYPALMKDPNTRVMLDNTYNSSIRLIQIVNDFLDTSRIEQNRIQYLFEDFDLSALAGEVLKELSDLAKAKKLKLGFSAPAGTPVMVKADKNRTKQVLINLISNGIKFTDTGEVAVKLSVEQGAVRVDVSDTGHGIAKDQQALLFRKFQQTDENPLARDATQGTGLGLFISKSLVEGMSGKIWLERSDPQGSTFSFLLPLAQAPVAKIT